MSDDPGRQRQSILIVEDAPAILQLLMKILDGYTVRPASSGIMALKAIETEPPDLILLDIKIPEMDGYEVCKRLKADEAFREIPVIFLSGMHETMDKVKAFEAGGVDYITKPFQAKEVLARVKTHLSIWDLQKQLGEQNLQLQQQIIVCKQIEEELRKHKTHLEELVAERTAELRKINEELQKEITERKQAEEALQWKTALLEAQVNASIDGMLVVDENQKRIIINQRIIELWNVPQHILDNKDDTVLLQYVVSLVKYPEQFLEKVMYLYDHPNEISRDEIEFKHGMVMDRYSAPVLGKDGHRYGRIWFFRDITDRRKTEEALKKREAELEIKSTNLEEMNAALKVLLKERENDKIELEEKILSNVKELVLPYIEKLKKSRLDSQHMTYVDIVETNLNDIVSPFLQKMGLKYANLTPTEIEIANLIKNGKSTKEIGNLLHMSAAAINFHRNNIRKKLGINNEKVNLRSYLMSM